MPKRHRTKKQAPAKKPANRKIIIGSAIAVALAVLALLVLPKLLKPTIANGMSIGKPDAPVLVEEFSDFQCPWCSRFALETEPDLIQKYVETGKVQIKFVPFSFLGPESIRSAEAAYCAADQNKFWQYKDKLFQNQGAENSGGFSDSNLQRFARQVNLNMEDFGECLSSGKYAQQVQDDLTNGTERGINGTPYFFVNGEGPYASAELEIRIQAAVATIP